VSSKHALVDFNRENWSVGVKISNLLNANQSAKRREAALSIFVMRSAVDSEPPLLLKIILVN
jgi:hypothetical protein